MRQWLEGAITYPEYVTRDINKNNNFNFLRLLFAYIVVVFHAMTISGYSYSISKLFDGGMAVCGFFIISGFLIMRSYWTSVSAKSYFIKRCKRLLPAYYFVILICAICLCFLSSLTFGEYFTSPIFRKYVFSNALFMNFLQPSLPGVFDGHPVNGSLWTIKLEIGFYITVSIIAYAFNKCKTKKRINIFLAGLYVFGYAYRFICSILYTVTQNNFVGELGHQLPGYIQYFVVGIFFLVNYEFMRRYEKYFVIPALSIFVLHYFIDGSLSEDVGMNIDCLFPIALGTITMFNAFNFSKLNSIGKNGDYSYGVYIFHFPLIQVLITFGYFQVNKNISILIIIGVVFSIAYIKY